jgi:hypothetical protein
VRVRGGIGVVLCVIGVVFLLQGTNAMHGSGMSGKGGWAVVGVIAVVIGLFLLIRAARSGRSRSTQ